jgi:hypothetical protein
MSDPRQSRRPRAIIHRRILDAAAETPSASIADLAGEVSGATPDLVERVLDDYGDPAAGPPDAATAESTDAAEPSASTAGATGTAEGDESPAHRTDAESSSDHDAVDRPTDGVSDDDNDDHDTGVSDDDDNDDHDTGVSDDDDNDDHDTDTTPASDTMTDPSTLTRADLTDKQRRVLDAIARHPDATQAELANHLDVSRGTVSNWANSIEGFEWSRRREFAAAVEDAPASGAVSGNAAADPGGGTPDGATDGAVDHGKPVDDVASDGGRAEAGAASAGTTSADATADGADDRDGVTAGADPERSLRADVESLSERVAALEDRVEATGEIEGNGRRTAGDGRDRPSGGPFEDEELAAKVVRACVADDAISEDEEVRILGRLLR